MEGREKERERQRQTKRRERDQGTMDQAQAKCLRRDTESLAVKDPIPHDGHVKC